ncbi:MAG TPA: serine/threonine-protein kinase, partial [Herpetosiphonaceae bacterium]
MQDPLIGQQIDRYAIVELLGSGGMARVFRAVDQGLDREVALKVVEPPRFGADEFSARFQREAQTLAGLQHPAIVPIYTFGRHGPFSYLVQELLPGPTLEQEIRTAKAGGGFLAADAITATIRQVAGALDYAHRRGIIHRDLKPSNLMRNTHGMMILTDFGIAKSGESLDKLTKTGMVLGTPHYLAPEQAQGQPLTPAADIYALGVLLYETIANRVPFDDAAPLAIALAHVTQPPPALRSIRPELPPAVEDVVFTALAKAPEQRFPSAGALADALERAWAAGPAVIASPTAALSPAQPVRPPVIRSAPAAP